MNNQNNEFLNWGEGFTAQENEFVLLDEGVYNFTVTKMEKKVYDGNSTKIPNGCPYAELTIQVESQKGTANIRERLYLMKSMLWKLTQFFAGIGQPVVTGQPLPLTGPRLLVPQVRLKLLSTTTPTKTETTELTTRLAAT